MFISIFFVLMKSFVKNGYFHGHCKKDKKNHKERLILKPIFDYLHRLHKKSGFI
jgi:hypothetical protein